MSPAVPSEKRYVENEDFVPDPTAMRGTFDTSGVGAPQNDYDSVVPVFEIAREREKDSPRINGEEVAYRIANAGEPEVTSPVDNADEVREARHHDASVVEEGTVGEVIPSEVETIDTTGTSGRTESKVFDEHLVPLEEQERAAEASESDEVEMTEEEKARIAEAEGTPEPTETPEADGDLTPAEAEAQAAAETEGTEAPADAEGEYKDDPEFTPVGRTVDAVNEYLATASPEERQRVLAIEAENRNRAGIMDGPHAA